MLHRSNKDCRVPPDLAIVVIYSSRYRSIDPNNSECALTKSEHGTEHVDMQTDKKIAREHFISNSFAVDIWWGKTENLFFPGEDKSVRAGKSISWPAARPARDRTSRYAFYNIFPSQFPFAHRRWEPKVSLRERKRKIERQICFHEHGCNFNPLTLGKRERQLM